MKKLREKLNRFCRQMKTPAGRRAAVVVPVCCFLSGALYTANYHIPGNADVPVLGGLLLGKSILKAEGEDV